MTPANTSQLDKLKARLGRLPTSISKAVLPRLDASGAALVAEMQRNCPVDSGALRDSIKAVPTADGTGVKVQVGGPSAPYALHVEFGTSKMHAEPFVFPAFRTLRASIATDLKKAATDAAKGSQ